MINNFNHLSLTEKIKFRQATYLFGYLDYPKTKISMHAENKAQIFRMESCKKEPETVTWLEENFKPGQILYDIGANIGAYSLLARAIANGDCHIYAFEPSYANYYGLLTNIIQNYFENEITAFNLALSEQRKLGRLNYFSTMSGGNSVLVESKTQASNNEVTLPAICYRLDDFVEDYNLQLPDHIKLDVDGVEPDVLAGAVKTLQSPNLKTVLIEVDEKAFGNQIYDLMESHNFKIESKHKRINSDVLFNCIFRKN